MEINDDTKIIFFCGELPSPCPSSVRRKIVRKKPTFCKECKEETNKLQDDLCSECMRNLLEVKADNSDELNIYFCYDACGKILNLYEDDWIGKKVKCGSMFAMATVCADCDKKNPKTYRI
jgi:hypothetical protein